MVNFGLADTLSKLIQNTNVVMELGTVIVKILEVASQSNLKQLQGSAVRDEYLPLILSSCIDRVQLSPSLYYININIAPSAMFGRLTPKAVKNL